MFAVDRGNVAIFLKKTIKRLIGKNHFISPPESNYVRRPYDEFVIFFNFFNVSQLPPDGLLLGDSVAERISRDDTDKRTLAQMMASDMANVFNLSTISYSAFNLHIFFYFIKALQKMRQKPKFVILPINMRSFSPQWDLEPSWQFEREINLIDKFISDPTTLPSDMSGPDDFGNLYEEFDSTLVNYRLTSLNRIGHFRLVISGKSSTIEQKRFRLAQIFIFHYTHELFPDHHKLIFLKKIMALLQEMNVYGVLYVSPINVDAGNKYVGKAFSETLRANVAVVKETVADVLMSDSCLFLDYSELLSSKYFFHEDEATEHLNQDGRKILASLVIAEVQKSKNL
jgi:hypothetical protein